MSTPQHTTSTAESTSSCGNLQSTAHNQPILNNLSINIDIDIDNDNDNDNDNGDESSAQQSQFHPDNCTATVAEDHTETTQPDLSIVPSPVRPGPLQQDDHRSPASTSAEQQHTANTNPSTPILSPSAEPIPLTPEEPALATSSSTPQPQIPPPLTLSHIPSFISTEEPPPYSPTHTILPHYFSLEPIPIRTYIIKDSSSVPFLFDFWLSVPVNGSFSRPQSPTIAAAHLHQQLQQERGPFPSSAQYNVQQQLQQQYRNELKFCIIRPQHTDRTAISSTHSSASNPYFIPALALVAANHPSRWIWWGTEALQMVVFGRQLKNIIMEWRWKHGRTRIGGPVVNRLVGCSFRVADERRFCWKIGSGRPRRRGVGGSTSAAAAAAAGAMIVPGQQQSAINRVGNNWFGSFFGRTTTPPLPSSERHDSNTIALEHVRISISSESTPDGLHPSPSDPATLREQESAAATAADQEDDEEAGCYHLREESLTGTTGRIVAVYRPGRPANRALDRPAMSKRLEIFTELGEKCETALMLMCVRLDDLFMAIPDDKKGSFTDPVAVQRNGGRSGNGSEGAGGGEDTTEQGGETEGGEPGGRESGTGEGEDDRRSEISVMKRLLGGRHTWRLRIKWVIATILVAVVIVLILKPKFSQSS